jgi:uncharacterized protein (DUF1499 family)
MITIFCDFSQFSAKKLAFFLNTNVMIKNLHNLALFSVKNANIFAEFFGENILKIITSVPRKTCVQATDLNIPAAKKTEYQAFAVDQMEYLLAKTGRR